MSDNNEPEKFGPFLMTEVKTLARKLARKYSRETLANELAMNLVLVHSTFGYPEDFHQALAFLDFAEKSNKFDRFIKRNDRINALMKAGKYKQADRLLNRGKKRTRRIKRLRADI